MWPFRKDRKPAWASHFSGSDWSAFAADLKSVVAEFGGGTLNFADGTFLLSGDDSTFGMTNLAQKWLLTPAAERPAVLRGHLESLLRMPGMALLEGEALLEALRVRLFPDDTPTPDCVVRHPIPGTLAILVADLPETVISVTPDQLETTGLDADAAFQRGLDNVRAKEDGQLSVETIGGWEFSLLGGDSFFIASHALVPEAVPGFPLDRETLLILPNRHTFGWAVSQPDIEAQQAEALRRAARAWFDEGPGSVSPHLYLRTPDGQIAIVP